MKPPNKSIGWLYILGMASFTLGCFPFQAWVGFVAGGIVLLITSALVAMAQEP